MQHIQQENSLLNKPLVGRRRFRYDSAMNITFVITNNLMDLSKVREAETRVLNDVETSTNLDRLIHTFSAGPGDRKFHIILDYFLYEKDGLDTIRQIIEEPARRYKVSGIKYSSFVPHEKIDELCAQHPDVNFIPRSKFFKDITKHIS